MWIYILFLAHRSAYPYLPEVSLRSDHSRKKGKDQQCLAAVLLVGIQGSEQPIGPEQCAECSWLFRSLAERAEEKEVASGKEKTQDAGKTGPGGAWRGWTCSHGWEGERQLPAERRVSTGTGTTRRKRL